MRAVFNLLLLLMIMIVYLPLAIVALTSGQLFRLLDSVLKQFDKLIGKIS
jgi:hypothetical protein